MIKVGITGQDGFVGQHLYQTLGLFPEEFERVNFKREFFDDNAQLNLFVSQCDVIVHLAAKNRHNDPDEIYRVNLDLVEKLKNSLEETNSDVHMLFSSSSQEMNNNEYGRSKKEGRAKFEEWAKERTGSKFTGFIIPNVFGPFGNPYYNSFIATFCHQLSHNEVPKIDVDGRVKLIYVGNLVDVIVEEIRNGKGNPSLTVLPTDEYYVSEILDILKSFKDSYLDNGIIPSLTDVFQLNLFNTFRSYIDIQQHFPVKFTLHTDNRGTFTEIIRLNVGGQISFSTTFPGVTRGNHFHTRKIERFSVIKGKAVIQLRKVGSDDVLNFQLSGDDPAYVDMPIWYTHNIKNIGEEELYTIFWINEFFDPNNPDTYFQTV